LFGPLLLPLQMPLHRSISRPCAYRRITAPDNIPRMARPASPTDRQRAEPAAHRQVPREVELVDR